MIIPMQYNYLGNGYLTPIKSGAQHGYHTGLDLNWKRKGGGAYDDLGLPISAMSHGVVIYTQKSNKGWGNMIILHHRQHGVYTRYAHLQTIHIKVGQNIKTGQEIGTCGKTGTLAPHLHFDVIKRKLQKWTSYVWGWNRERVRNIYANPIAFIESNQPEIPEWAKSAWEKAMAKGITPESPFQEVGPELMQIILKDSGVLQEIGKLPAYRFMKVLEKMKIL